MEVEMKDIRNEAQSAEATMADAATGAVLGIVDAASHPLGTARRQVRKLERRGQPTNRKLGRQMDEAMETGEEILDGTIPEKFLLSGLRLVKNTARRRDLVGDVAYRTLRVVNGGLEATLRTLNRFENASEPPTRPTKSRSTGPARRGTRPAAATRRRVSATAKTAVKSTRKSAAKTTRSARTAARKTA